MIKKSFDVFTRISSQDMTKKSTALLAVAIGYIYYRSRNAHELCHMHITPGF